MVFKLLPCYDSLNILVSPKAKLKHNNIGTKNKVNNNQLRLLVLPLV